MNRKLKILTIVVVLLCVFIFSWREISSFKFSDEDQRSVNELDRGQEDDKVSVTDSVKKDYFMNDSIYKWDEQRVDWVSIGLYKNYQNQVESNSVSVTLSEPIRVKWERLLNIKYRLRYFQKKQVDMFAPVFDNELKSLDGKEVIIEGFVIPVDEEGELVTLSANPYSSCYFCGNASPASVISMFMKDKDDRFGLDEYKKFKGTLILNYDDPDQFYYLLENAEEI